MIKFDRQDGWQRWRRGGLLSASVVVAAGAVSFSMEAWAGDYVKRGPDVVARNQTVFQRSRPVYDEKGIDLSGFTLLPSLEVSETYDDNVYAVSANEQDDFETVIEPQLALKSNWARHSLSIGAFGRIHRFMDIDTENSSEYGANFSGALDLPRQSSLVASGGFERRTVDRSDPDQTGTVGAEPQQLDVTSGALAYSHPFGRIRLTLSGTVENYKSVDDADVTQNRVEYGAKLRVAYQISAALSAFVEPYYTIRDSRDSFINRDSDVFGTGVGVAYDITGLLYGETTVGYYQADFDNAAFKTDSGIFVRSQATWNLSALTSLILGIERGNVATSASGASSRRQTAFDLRLERELTRNVIAALTGRYEMEKYQDTVPRDDDVIRVGGLLSYFIDRHVSLFAQYEFQDRSSNLAGADFTENRITLGVRGQI